MISLMFDPDSDLFLVVSVIFYFGTQNFFYLFFTIRLNSVCPLYGYLLNNPFEYPKKKSVIFNSVSSVQQGKPPPSGKAPKEEQEHGHWLNFDVDNFENSMVSSASDCI